MAKKLIAGQEYPRIDEDGSLKLSGNVGNNTVVASGGGGLIRKFALSVTTQPSRK